jgi:hypothetical protein
MLRAWIFWYRTQHAQALREPKLWSATEKLSEFIERHQQHTEGGTRLHPPGPHFVRAEEAEALTELREQRSQRLKLVSKPKRKSHITKKLEGGRRMAIKAVVLDESKTHLSSWGWTGRMLTRFW